jgi:glycosyltransferase involved in cell wall biosynthesis
MSTGSPRLPRIRRRDAVSYDVAFHVPGIEQLLTKHAVPPTGGAQNQVFLLAQELARCGLRVALLVFDLPEGGLPDRVGTVDVLVRRRPATHQRGIGKARSAIALWRLLAEVRTNVVVTRTAGPHVPLIALASWALRRPYIYSSASYLDFHWESRFARRHDRWLFRRSLLGARELVVQTEEQAELCVARLGRRPIVVGSIAEPAAPVGGRRDSFLWIGRAYENKRPLAFVRLAEAVPEARFQMIAVPSPGREDAMSELEHAAAGVENLELLPGVRRAELPSYLERAVAVVNTSDFEGMPNVFLEGWTRGIPALALSFDPGRVIETHGVGAFAHGSEPRLAELTRELWERRGNTAELAGRCRRYASEHHDPSFVAAQWVEVIRSVAVRQLSESHA